MIKRHIQPGVLIASLALLGSFLLSRPAAAQSEPATRIQQIRVVVMPEFDDPRVLVIIQGRMTGIANDAQQAVTFRLPAGVQINQMAFLDVTTGETIPQPFDLVPDPADPRWSLVTYTLHGAHFFYEYYEDSLSGGPTKAFTYRLKSLQPIDDLRVEIQEPLRATSFRVEPVSTNARFDNTLAGFAFNYHQYEMGPIAADEELTFSVNYAKSDPAPSVPRESMPSGQDEAVSVGNETVSPASADKSGVAPWVLAVAGTFLIVFAGGYARLRHRSVPAQASEPARDLQLPHYCTQCGAPLRSEARFCHVCGTGAVPQTGSR